jgi:hypothetical protein
MIRVIGFEKTVELREVTCNKCYAINQYDPRKDTTLMEPFGAPNRRTVIRCGNCSQYIDTSKSFAAKI